SAVAANPSPIRTMDATVSTGTPKDSVALDGNQRSTTLALPAVAKKPQGSAVEKDMLNVIKDYQKLTEDLAKRSQAQTPPEGQGGGEAADAPVAQQPADPVEKDMLNVIKDYQKLTEDLSKRDAAPADQTND